MSKASFSFVFIHEKGFVVDRYKKLEKKTLVLRGSAVMYNALCRSIK